MLFLWVDAQCLSSLSSCCQSHSFALNERKTVVKESPTLYVYSIRLTSLLLSNVGSMLSMDLSTMCKIPLEAIISPCKSFPFLFPPWILILSWLSWKKTGSSELFIMEWQQVEYACWIISNSCFHRQHLGHLNLGRLKVASNAYQGNGKHSFEFGLGPCYFVSEQQSLAEKQVWGSDLLAAYLREHWWLLLIKIWEEMI